MSSRGKSRPTMSLLAFQDIITSVSGILMFIVLMLSLELSNESPTASAAPSVDDMNRLEAAIAVAKDDRQRLEANLIANSDDAVAAATAAAPEELRADVLHLDQRIAATEAAIALLEQQHVELGAAAAAQGKIDAKSTAEHQAAAERMRSEIAGLKRDLSIVRTDERPVFTLPRGFNKTGWLVVISADRCEVASLGRRAAPRSFPTATGGLFRSGPDVSQFLAWTKTLAASEAYLLLIVRPDGTDVFKEISDSLEERGIAFGFDLSSPGRRLLDPERGAFQ